MKPEMKNELFDFDIFPKVFLTDVEETITVQSLGMRKRFIPGKSYQVNFKEVERAEDSRFPGSGSVRSLDIIADDKGLIVTHMDFPREGMYLVEVHDKDDDSQITSMRVYALSHDMKGRLPFRGDLHMHTCRSDGRELPATVAAHYRGYGYDFTVISDHERYYPSLEARKALEINQDDCSDITDLLVVPGEEVHLPLNAVHYVNFGGSFSINGLVTPSSNQEEGDDVFHRSIDGNCPPTMTREEYIEMIKERSKSVPRDIESERLSFASAQWIYEMQKKAGGIGIFPHPYWLCSTMQLSEDYTYFFYENHPFDVFEVLGGERYYQHNGFQTCFYYEEKAKGIDYPVVGSTDSHSSVNNPGGLICSTIVFAPQNTTRSLVDSIKSKYSVAIDSISKEYRLVGDFRWVKYGSFLMEEWFPLHDQACAAEGFYLMQYLSGNQNARNILKALKGSIPAMMHKYFHI